MRIPIKWLKEYIACKKSPEEIAESFTLLGLLLDKQIANEVLDLEHRMERSDHLSIIGCARDLAAREGLTLKEPESHTEGGKVPSVDQIVEIKVECPNLVKRFNTRTFRNIKVKESPKWLKERLEAYGIPSKNNIVDITNYVMVEYGQPMHAQDLAKFAKPEIVIRMAKKGEKITTLHGDLVDLDEETFILAQNDAPIAIGGIVGGADTGVTESTTAIVLDAGNYDQASIRKTSRRLKIQNETVSRYDKFLHPKLTEIAIERAAKLILDLAGGEYLENIDYYPETIPLKTQEISLKRIKTIGGVDFAMDKVKKILTSLGYAILKEESKSLQVEVPYWRTDIAVEDDLISDVLRINGYENIKSQLMQNAPPKEITSEYYKFEERCQDILVALGLHEHITEPLVSANENNKEQVKLESSFSSEKGAMRTSIYETLKPVLDIYKKHGVEGVGLFEIGKIYEKKGTGSKLEDYVETRVIEAVFSMEGESAAINEKVGGIFFGFLHNLGIYPYRPKLKDREVGYYQDELLLGVKRLDSFCFYTENLYKAKKIITRVKVELTHKMFEDITFTYDVGKPLGEKLEKIKEIDTRITNVEVIKEYKDEKIGKGKNSITIRVTFEDRNEIPSKEITALKEKITDLL